MKNFFQRIWFTFSVCLLTACNTHQPLRCNNDEKILQQLARYNITAGMRVLVTRVDVDACCKRHSAALIEAASHGAREAVNFLFE